MDDNRLTNKILQWDIQWNGPQILHMDDVLCKYGLEELIFRQETINILTLKEIVLYKMADESWTKPKLYTYHEIKYEHYTENYVLYNLSKKEISLCSDWRRDIASPYWTR